MRLRLLETSRIMSVEEIRAFFEGEGKTVLTFVGFSGSGYEDPEAMLEDAGQVLDELEAAETIVNIGGTLVGIGAIYELAKRRGFTTTGIVSSQAKESGVELSPDVDRLFFVDDAAWGGLVEGTDRLSPTSTAMIGHSDIVVGIGGGEVARVEMLAAMRSGKDVRFIPAEMNHETAREKALNRGRPTPIDFRGAAHQEFIRTSDRI